LTGTYELTSRYELAFGVAAEVSLVAFVLIRSRAGLGLLAVREDEEAARASGVSALRHKLAALGLSSFFAGLTGATYAYYQPSYYPQLAFDPNWTFDAIIITYVGGVGTIVGPIVGAIFYIVLREKLTLSFTQFHQVIFGLLFIVVVLALPGGLVDIWSRLRRGRGGGSAAQVERKAQAGV
jgi:branched-chain amino acid transport system permease protein